MKKTKSRVLITGSGSYIGSKFHEYAKDTYDVTEMSVRGDDWEKQSFAAYDTVLHVAGIAHRSAKNVPDETYFKVNRDLAIRVAEKAKKDGVKQFIFLSSMFVYKEPSSIHEEIKITSRTLPNPITAYGASKLEAEYGIQKLGSKRYSVAIVRLPMVYGHSAKGNFGKLVKLALISPIFPSIDNKRSVIFIDNICEFLSQLIENGDNGIYHPQDPQYLNTTSVMRTIRSLEHRRSYPTRLLNPVVNLGSKVTPILTKVFGSIYYDDSISIYRDDTYREIFKADALTATIKARNNLTSIPKKVIFTATVDSVILAFLTPYLRWFHDQGYEVHVATNGTAEIPYCDVRHTVSFARSPLKLDNLRAISQLKKIIDREKFDLIHTHTPMGSVVTRLAALRDRKKYHTRVIYTAHGFHFYRGAPKLNWLLFYPIEKILARFTDTLITINKEDYELARKKLKTDVQYVPGVGIDTAKFNFKMTRHDRNALRKSLGLKPTDFVMLFPAEISKRKRQIWLINTLNDFLHKNPSAHLLLPGLDSLNGEAQRLVQTLGLENNVHFLGYRNDIPRLMAIADIAVSSARQEGLPVNIMEAMYLGVPVVSSNCRGNRDLVHNGKNGFLVPLGDSVLLVKKIALLLSNKAKRNVMGEAGKAYIIPYLLDNILTKMTKIYQND